MPLGSPGNGDADDGAFVLVFIVAGILFLLGFIG